MIRHHPDEAWLLGHATGTLATGASLVVGAHLEGCAHCRAAVRRLEAVGGALLEAIEPAPLAPEALARTLERIDRPEAPAPAAPAPWRPELPGGTAWPRSLRHCEVSRWRLLGPGMRWSRVTVPHDPSANVFLLRIGAGKCLPRHTHSDCELTQVLHGTFDDGRGIFGPGDFDAADTAVHHQPVVQAQGECICLASVDGRVLFDGLVARWFGNLVGM